ncbi:lipoprotein NlpI [Bacteroidales bacterium Barb6XT]|nr:lipoprotein NlpI [Bacteroidales bacterium Barb6XT]
MGNFLFSLFSSKKEEADGDVQKDELKKFDILKYDGMRAQRINRADYAVKCFTEALRIQKDFETMNYLVSAYVATHEPEKALSVLNEMIEVEPDNMELLLTRAHLLFQTGKGAEAVPDCLRAVEADEANPVAGFLLAKARRAAGDFSAAADCLTKVVNLKEDFADAFLLRAEVYLDMQQGEEALADALSAIRLVPEEEAAYLLRGRIQAHLGDTEAAESDYRKVLELNPFNEDAFLLLGSSLISSRKYDAAIALFDEALEQNEQFARAYAERARAKELNGDKEGALEDLATARKLAAANEEDGAEQPNFDDLYKGGIF